MRIGSFLSVPFPGAPQSLGADHAHCCSVAAVQHGDGGLAGSGCRVLPLGPVTLGPTSPIALRFVNSVTQVPSKVGPAK